MSGLKSLRALAAACVAGIALLAAPALPARELAAQPGSIAESALPQEARATLTLIKQGGPFPYRRDGIVFGNRERRLPIQPYGYYHEYTVRTPGAQDRGARRIIAGEGPQRDVRSSGEYYYSPDHYRSFKRIRD
ncbi:MAG: ribonuclease [Rhodocyclaceae bacterium]|nr:ribonuclease [Rhodocyclaceae bacterium]MBX3670331.1 ribonuclease [Rhodocyclaceae bacterium]